MTINGAITQLVMMTENSMMPNIFRPALNKVIETISELEPEPQLSNNSPKLDNKNGELISRQEAIDAIEHRLAEPAYQHTGEDWYVGMNCAESELYNLPSTQPRKRGKWDFMGWQMFQCSECKHTFTQDFLEGWRAYTYESHFPPFCPNCGCDMRGNSE